MDGYGPQDVEEEVLLVVLVDRVENEVFDDEVGDLLVDLLDDELLVDFVGINDVPELLERAGVLVVRDDERLLVPFDDDEKRVLDWTLELELRNDDDSKLELDVTDIVVLDWWLLELEVDNVDLVDVEEDTVLEESFPELEDSFLELELE